MSAPLGCPFSAAHRHFHGAGPRGSRTVRPELGHPPTHHDRGAPAVEGPWLFLDRLSFRTHTTRPQAMPRTGASFASSRLVYPVCRLGGSTSTIRGPTVDNRPGCRLEAAPEKRKNARRDKVKKGGSACTTARRSWADDGGGERSEDGAPLADGRFTNRIARVFRLSRRLADAMFRISRGNPTRPASPSMAGPTHLVDRRDRRSALLGTAIPALCSSGPRSCPRSSSPLNQLVSGWQATWSSRRSRS